jgi:hypothetical protein
LGDKVDIDEVKFFACLFYVVWGCSQFCLA